MPFDVEDWKQVSSRPPTELGIVNVQNGSSTGNFPLPSDVQALVVVLEESLANWAHLKVAWHPATPGADPPWVPLELFVFPQAVWVVPILPASRDINGSVINTIDVTVQSAGNTFVRAEVFALLEANPLWLQLFPLPQLEPNQFPKTVILTLSALVAQWAIQSAANVQITLFNIVVMRYNPSAANDDFILGYSAALPPNAQQPPAATVLVDSTQTAASGAGPMFTIPLAGVQLPRGAGLWADTSLSAIANLWLLIEYSLG